MMSSNEFLRLGSFSLGLAPCLLAALVLLAAWLDSKTRRIPNWLVLQGVVISLITQLTVGAGFQSWILGAAVGFLSFLPFYTVRAMGAGDVKLMAMVGSFVGPYSAFGIVLATLIAGGVLALAVAIRKGALLQTVLNIRFSVLPTVARSLRSDGTSTTEPLKSTGNLPYAVPIAAGTLTHLILQSLGRSFF